MSWLLWLMLQWTEGCGYLFETMISLHLQIPKNEITGSYNSSIFNFGGTSIRIYISNQQCIRVSILPHPHQYLSPLDNTHSNRCKVIPHFQRISSSLLSIFNHIIYFSWYWITWVPCIFRILTSVLGFSLLGDFWLLIQSSSLLSVWPDFLFLPDLDLVDCMFTGIHPFLLRLSIFLVFNYSL